MASSGHVKRRRGILGHLQDGRITLLESGAHDVIGMLADKASGIWFGSARALAANCGAGDVSERQARHLMESLEQKGYIRRFATPRAHGNYPILVNKYEVTFGAQRGMRLNAILTRDWRHPRYESCPEQGAEQGAERAPLQEVRSEKEKVIPRTPRAGFPSLPKTGHQEHERKQAAKQQRLALERVGIPRDRQEEKQLRRRREATKVDEWINQQREIFAPPMTEAQLVARRAELKRQAEQILRSA